MTGGVVSITLTKFVQCAALPQQSVACQTAVMVFEHSEVVLLERLTSTTETFEQQASKAVGGMSDHVLPHCTVWLLEHVMTGGRVSTSVTCCVQTVVLLQQSVTCQMPSQIVWQSNGVTILLVVIV